MYKQWNINHEINEIRPVATTQTDLDMIILNDTSQRKINFI